MVRQAGTSNGHRKLQTVEGVRIMDKREACFKVEKDKYFNIAVMRKEEK